MATVTVRAREKDSLARSLGWFGVGLGSAQLAAPRALCRLVGAADDGRSPLVMRLLGVREAASGLGILVRPRPTGWLWARVAGDALDLSLLGLLAVRHPARRARTAVALANVAAVTIADVFESVHLTRKRGQPQAGQLIRKAVTINRSREEVEEAWRQAAELRRKVDEEGAFVSFEPAPGERGTELAVELVYAPRGGDLGAAAKKLGGADLPTELSDDLRRFKQLVETGEVMRSDSTPSGHLLSEHVKQRPAQPLEEVPR